MSRAITFPKTGADEWVNRETGVSIYGNPGSYFVLVPTIKGRGTDLSSFLDGAVTGSLATLAEARAEAKVVALRFRTGIARAHAEALLAFAVLMADKAEAALDGAVAAEVFSPVEADRLYGYLTTAKLFRESDPERSIGWSNEVLEQTSAAADRETAAVQSLAGKWPLGHGGGKSLAVADELERISAEPGKVTREQAHKAWGRVWAGSVPEGLVDSFKAGDYVTALRLAEEQIAKQEAATAGADHDRRAAREALAREWYAHAGYDLPLTGTEVSAGFADWDAGNAGETERRESYHAADLVLDSQQPEIVNYRRGGLWSLALLAIRDTFGLRSSTQRARVMFGAGRPAGWGTAWLEAEHPGQIDVATGAAPVPTTALIERGHPGPM